MKKKPNNMKKKTGYTKQKKLVVARKFNPIAKGKWDDEDAFKNLINLNKFLCGIKNFSLLLYSIRFIKIADSSSHLSS